MSVTEAAVSQVGTNHVIIFLRDSNRDVSALEFGTVAHQATAREEAEQTTHGHHAPTPHSQGHQHHAQRHAHQTEHDYPIHQWLPLSQRPGPAPALPAQWTAVGRAGQSADAVAHQVKHGVQHHAAHAADASSFSNYVMTEVLGCRV